MDKLYEKGEKIGSGRGEIFKGETTPHTTTQHQKTKTKNPNPKKSHSRRSREWRTVRSEDHSSVEPEPESLSVPTERIDDN